MKRGTKTIIALISALLLCTMAAPVLAQPDLVVTYIGPDYIFADLTNVLSAQVKNTDLNFAAGEFNVSISITDEFSTELYSNKVSVGPLAMNSSVAVPLGNWKPIAVENITITVVADCDNNIFEGNETNNASVKQRTTTGDCDADTMLPDTCYGYRGQHPLQGIYSGAGNQGLIYTTGDYKYKNETVNFNIGTDTNEITGTTSGIPVGATIKYARLYEYFCWRKTETGPNPGLDPRPDFDMSINGNSLTADEYYTDMKGFKSSQYQYGTLAYDVTADVTGNGAYQAVRSNYVSGKGYTSGMALLIAYEDASCPHIEYHINEGYDRLATAYGTQYHVLPEDATTTASFPCVYNAITDATLFTATTDTNGVSEALDFNDGGPWSPVWFGSSSYPIAIDSRNVVSELQSNPFCNPEIAEFQEDGSGFAATNAILIVEMESPKATVFFEPSDSGANYGDTTTVGVWVNTSEVINGGTVIFDYTFCCANVTGYTPSTTTNWDFINMASLGVPGTVTIGFGTLDPAGRGPGLLHIGDLDIQCCSDSYCETDLVWNKDPSMSYLERLAGGLVSPVKWDDGTFTCTNLPDLMITEVYGTQTTGDNYVVTYTVKNEGNANAPAGHSTTLSIDGAVKEHKAVPIALGPGDTYTGTFDIELTMTALNDLVKVCADNYGEVIELDEDNNCMQSYYPAGIEIKVEAPDDCVNYQEQFLVNITVDPRNIPVYGVEYVLSFNNLALHAEWQNEGTFLNSDEAETNVYINNIDNSAGTISFAATRVGAVGGVTTSGTLAVIKFTAIQQDASSNLNLSDVVAANDAGNEIQPLDLIDDDVCVSSNLPPVAAGKSTHMYNNDGQKYLCKVYFDGTESNDSDGEILYWRWSFGDGNYGTGEVKDHVYQSWNWNGTAYEPFNVSLTVTDDGDPHQLDDTTYIEVIVYTAGDANGDGKVNILDATIVGLEWGKTSTNGDYCWEGNERADKADLNNDERVNILDAVIIGTCWGHTAW
jgi:hypothetical protein